MANIARPRIGSIAALAAPIVAWLAAPARAQDGAAAETSLWELFLQSFDLFSVVLLAGSIAAVAYIVRAVMDVRGSAIGPEKTIEALDGMVKAGRLRELVEFARRDGSLPARVVGAAAAALDAGLSREAAREAADLAAGEESARWFRKIEPLNVIGNLGPLVGLAGTVWGMILAFTSLGQSGGQAGPADLSLGISKALFHTLLGLCLATPCLFVFGMYRMHVDRHCNRAMAACTGLIERLPERPPG